MNFEIDLFYFVLLAKPSSSKTIKARWLLYFGSSSLVNLPNILCIAIGERYIDDTVHTISGSSLLFVDAIFCSSIR